MSRVNLEDVRLERAITASGMKLGITALPDANATLTVGSGPICYATPGASRTYTLPAVTADMRGLAFYFITQAAFTLVVKESGGLTIATVPASVGATGLFVCLGNSALGIGGWIGGL